MKRDGVVVKFSDLAIGDQFDFIGPDIRIMENSFFDRCTKISDRNYCGETGVVYRVGSINAVVYHVAIRAHYIATGKWEILK